MLFYKHPTERDWTRTKLLSISLELCITQSNNSWSNISLVFQLMHTFILSFIHFI